MSYRLVSFQPAPSYGDGMSEIVFEIDGIAHMAHVASDVDPEVFVAELAASWAANAAQAAEGG